MKDSIAKLKTLIESERGYDLYNIMGAIRGNDRDEEKELKIITAVIRGYLGFNGKNCSGWADGGEVTKDEFMKQLQIINELTLQDKTTHYVFHLSMAIHSIGRDKLIEFVTKNQITEEDEDDDEFEEDDDLESDDNP